MAKPRKRREFGPGDFVIVLAMVMYALIVLLPMLWVVVTSFKTNAEFTRDSWGLPAAWRAVNYYTAWTKANFHRFAFNSVWITAVSVVLTVVLAAPTAYILTRMQVRLAGRRLNRLLLFLFISGLYMPVALVLPTEFLLLNDIGLFNSQWGLVLLYVAFSLPYSILVLNGFYLSLPREIEEAAAIDGASRNRAFWQIVFPMSSNGVSTVVIMNLIWIWNDYIFALTFLQDKDKMTLPVGLIGLMESFKLKADWVTLFAGLCLVMLPSIAVFLVFQKRMTRGLTAGAVKE